MSYFHHAVARLILSTFHPQVLDIQMVPALIGGSREKPRDNKMVNPICIPTFHVQDE